MPSLYSLVEDWTSLLVHHPSHSRNSPLPLTLKKITQNPQEASAMTLGLSNLLSEQKATNPEHDNDGGAISFHTPQV